MGARGGRKGAEVAAPAEHPIGTSTMMLCSVEPEGVLYCATVGTSPIPIAPMGGSGCRERRPSTARAS